MQKGESCNLLYSKGDISIPYPLWSEHQIGNLFRRNRKHLRKTKDTDKSVFDKSIVMETSGQQEAEQLQNNVSDTHDKEIPESHIDDNSHEVQEQSYRTRSGRVVRVPERYRD